jgi:16S rRNA processing protein RimM
MPLNPKDLLAIAHLTRPHGVRGEVSAIPLTPPVIDPAALIVNKRLYLRDPQNKICEIQGEEVRVHQARWLIKLSGIESMDDADALRESDLCLPRSELPELPEGWYYETDLEGCEVIDERLGTVGIVVGLETGYSQPQLRIRRSEGRIVLVPWRDRLFPGVDLAARRITSRLPSGLPGIEDQESG